MFTQLPDPVALLLLGVVVPAGIVDLRTRRIPNWLTLPGIVLGIAINTFVFKLPGFERALGGAAIAFAVYFALYSLRAMGSGDVKLMTAVGAFAGPRDWLTIFLITSIAGGALALYMIVRAKRTRKTLENVTYILTAAMQFRAPAEGREDLRIKGEGSLSLPHGAVIALGCFVFTSWQFFMRVDQ